VYESVVARSGYEGLQSARARTRAQPRPRRPLYVASREVHAVEGFSFESSPARSSAAGQNVCFLGFVRQDDADEMLAGLPIRPAAKPGLSGTRAVAAREGLPQAGWTDGDGKPQSAAWDIPRSTSSS